ncbi:ADP-forming succinate--CoA ligase subunit beta [Alphaproteobacteria bacterium]|nr:ADP-forming succinate--CoA ligase subunit beta [Alphaproteobacteria bacterium]MDC1121087.1 ADP-forming succinate--CoA ligase subunit beta [Alphaproteobacteria bacterium]
MNIHEHQAKQILQELGAPIAKGAAITTIEQAESAVAALPGPVWVVKSQIHAGGRGKGKFKELAADAKGGVRVSFSADEALENIHEMFGKTLVTQQTGPSGKAVNRIYVEDGADIDRELYLSILVDRETGKTSFVASTEGGMDIETVAHDTPELIHSIGITASAGCTDSDAAKLANALQLDGTGRTQGMALFKNLYNAFVSKDMNLLEINPLIVTKSNDVQVLDAKVSFDGNALFRHPDIKELRDETEEDEKEVEASKHDLAYIALDGEIGCMVNGAGLAMATMDIIKLYGAEPANFLDVGGSATTERVTAAFKIITADPNVKGILVNIFGGIMRCDVIAAGVVQAAADISLNVPLVVRLEGTKVEEGKAIINESGLNVITADDLDDAAQKIVKAVKG